MLVGERVVDCILLCGQNAAAEEAADKVIQQIVDVCKQLVEEVDVEIHFDGAVAVASVGEAGAADERVGRVDVVTVPPVELDALDKLADVETREEVECACFCRFFGGSRRAFAFRSAAGDEADDVKVCKFHILEEAQNHIVNEVGAGALQNSRQVAADLVVVEVDVNYVPLFFAAACLREVDVEVNEENVVAEVGAAGGTGLRACARRPYGDDGACANLGAVADFGVDVAVIFAGDVVVQTELDVKVVSVQNAGQNVGKVDCAARRKVNCAVVFSFAFVRKFSFLNEVFCVRGQSEVFDCQIQVGAVRIAHDIHFNRFEFIQDVERYGCGLRVRKRNTFEVAVSVLSDDVFVRAVFVGVVNLCAGEGHDLIDCFRFERKFDEAFVQNEGNPCFFRNLSFVCGGNCRTEHAADVDFQSAEQIAEAEQFDLRKSQARKVGVNRVVAFDFVEAENFLLDVAVAGDVDFDADFRLQNTCDGKNAVRNSGRNVDNDLQHQFVGNFTRRRSGYEIVSEFSNLVEIKRIVCIVRSARSQQRTDEQRQVALQSVGILCARSVVCALGGAESELEACADCQFFNADCAGFDVVKRLEALVFAVNVVCKQGFGGNVVRVFCEVIQNAVVDAEDKIVQLQHAVEVVGKLQGKRRTRHVVELHVFCNVVGGSFVSEFRAGSRLILAVCLDVQTVDGSVEFDGGAVEVDIVLTTAVFCGDVSRFFVKSGGDKRVNVFFVRCFRVHHAGADVLFVEVGELVLADLSNRYVFSAVDAEACFAETRKQSFAEVNVLSLALLHNLDDCVDHGHVDADCEAFRREHEGNVSLQVADVAEQQIAPALTHVVFRAAVGCGEQTGVRQSVFDDFCYVDVCDAEFRDTQRRHVDVNVGAVDVGRDCSAHAVGHIRNVFVDFHSDFKFAEVVEVNVNVSVCNVMHIDVVCNVDLHQRVLKQRNALLVLNEGEDFAEVGRRRAACVQGVAEAAQKLDFDGGLEDVLEVGRRRRSKTAAVHNFFYRRSAQLDVVKLEFNAHGFGNDEVDFYRHCEDVDRQTAADFRHILVFEARKVRVAGKQQVKQFSEEVFGKVDADGAFTELEFAQNAVEHVEDAFAEQTVVLGFAVGRHRAGRRTDAADEASKVKFQLEFAEVSVVGQVDIDARFSACFFTDKGDNDAAAHKRGASRSGFQRKRDAKLCSRKAHRS